jgi:hypothetical protein
MLLPRVVVLHARTAVFGPGVFPVQLGQSVEVGLLLRRGLVIIFIASLDQVLLNLLDAKRAH